VRLVGTTLALLGLLALPGCGAVFHASQTVTLSVPPGTHVYQAGTKAKETAPGTYTSVVFLNQEMGETVAVAPGTHVKRVRFERHVDAAAIVCDVLWSLTIVGVAAPISDALLGTFVKTQSETVVGPLEPFAATDNPMPVYESFGKTVTASEHGGEASSPPAPATSASGGVGAAR